jgi:predicted kinase
MIISEIKKLIMEKSISLVIIRGCSGSGKSTLAKLLGSNFKHFEADMYFMKNGVYQFDGTKLGAAHGWCQSSVQKELSSGGKVVVSNTFTTHREIKPYVDICKSLKVNFMIIKCIGRYQNVHNVPNEVLDKMRDRWQDVEGEVTYNP